MLASELDPAGVKQEFEACLRETFGYDAWVVVLTADRVAALVEACPYPADDASTHTYLTLASMTRPCSDELFEAGSALDGTRAAPGWAPRPWPGSPPPAAPWTARSASSPRRPKYKAATTTRNLRTMIKVRDAAAGT